MASSADILNLRRLVDEPTTTVYADSELSTRIDTATGNIRTVAGEIWREKAATFATLADITEAGSSRKNSQLYANALSMAKSFDVVVEEPVAVAASSTTRPIQRA